MRTIKKKINEILDNLFEFLADPEGMTDEEITAELKEEGIDIDKIVAQIKADRGIK